MAIVFDWQQSGTTTNATSASVTAGGAINQNDLLIAVVVPETLSTNAAPGTVVAPLGWIQLDNTQLLIDNELPATAAIFYKIAGASEDGNYAFAWSDGANCSWTLMDYSGVNTSTPIDASAGATNTATYSPNTIAPSVVTANAGDTLVNIWISKGGAENSPRIHRRPSVSIRIPVLTRFPRSWSQTRFYRHPELPDRT